MVRLRSLVGTLFFSKYTIYILLLVSVVYFSRNASNDQQRRSMSKSTEMHLLYGSEDMIPPGADGGFEYEDILFPGEEHRSVRAAPPAPPPPPPQVQQSAMVGPPVVGNPEDFNGFQSSHDVEPLDLASFSEPVNTGIDNSRDPEEQHAAHVVQMTHDVDVDQRQHAKNPHSLHFASSHQAQLGRGHVISDDKHGAYVPHTYVSKSASHGHQDPYYSMHVRELELERMKTTLPATLHNYRNPCWVEHLPRGFSYFEHTLYYQYYRYYPTSQPHRDWEKTYDKLDHLIQIRKKKTKDGKSWRLRCFPYFHLIGFSRTGTTDLWRSMSLLPEFIRGLIKEPKFWSKVRMHNYADTLPNATLSDYLDLFDGVSEVIRGFSRKMPDGSYFHPGITADMDPQTIWKLPKWQHLKGNDGHDAPKFTSADHLHALHPHAKLLVMMRDPVERAFSHYCFFKTRKKYATKSELADKFHHDMVRATTKLLRCFKQRGAKSCAYQPPRYSALAMRSLTVGMYNVFIQDWFKPFHKYQFMFIKSEDYFDDRVKVIKQVSNFLGIDDTIPDALQASIEEFRVMNPSKKTGMYKETREMLRDFYRPFNKRLAKLLKQDRYHWDY